MCGPHGMYIMRIRDIKLQAFSPLKADGKPRQGTTKQQQKNQCASKRVREKLWKFGIKSSISCTEVERRKKKQAFIFPLSLSLPHKHELPTQGFKIYA